jgi:hypothetical protein
MAICETCENDYDKAFQVVQNTARLIRSIASNAPSMPWRQRVRIAAPVSLATVLRRKARSSAAKTAPKARAFVVYGIGCN